MSSDGGAPAARAGTRLGRYELAHPLGHGGMATVHLARAHGAHGFARWVAIKRIHPHLASDGAYRAMFVDEARICSVLHHPSIAQVIELGDDDGAAYLALEYLHGEPLSTLLEDSLARGLPPLSPTLVAWVGARVAEGLHHAHEARDERGVPMGVVHRDVSPQNVFLTFEGEVKITDFGVAKARDRLAHTQSGAMKGKLAYAAPEQLRRDVSLDRRVDVLALGVVLWEASTGARLFGGGSEVETVQRIATGYRVAPSTVVPGYPDALARILARAMAHDREERFPTALALAEALDAFAQGAPDAKATALKAVVRERLADRLAAREALLRGAGADATDVRDPAPPQPGAASSGSGVRTVSKSAPSSELVASPGSRRARTMALGLVAVLAALALAAWLSGPGASSAPSETLLVVRTEPAGAAVSLDGRALDGATPIEVPALRDGPHALALSLDGHAPLATTFEAQGGRLELSFSLSPVARARALEPEPSVPRAAVPAVEEPPATPPAQLAAPVEASAPEPRLRTLREEPRVTGRATLTLVTRPWARVWIDGSDAGETPLVEREIPAGRVRVRLVPEGTGAPRVVVIDARPGEHVQRNMEL